MLWTSLFGLHELILPLALHSAEDTGIAGRLFPPIACVVSAFVGRPVAEIRCLTNLNSVRTRSGGLRQPAMLTESLKTHTTKTRNSLSCAQISGGVARPGRSACAPNGTWRMSARSSGPGRSARHDSISSWQILTGLKVSYQLAQVDLSTHM